MTHLFGFCAPGPPGARPDQDHDACTRAYDRADGRRVVCECENHREDA